MSMSKLQRRRAWVPVVILVIAFAVLLVYAWPGYMSSDSAVQLQQGRSHQYSDGHPPMMAAMWGIVDHVVTGPAGMLIIQGAAFLGGLYLLLRRHMRALAAAIVASAIFLFPPVFATLGVIWKDSQMAGFLMLGIALLASPRRGLRWCGVVSITLAIGVRHNALVAAFPIFLFVWPGLPGRKTIVRLALATVLWIASTAVALETNAHLATIHEHAWHYSVGPADIAGILANTKHTYSDAELEHLLEGTPLVAHKDIQGLARRTYNPTYWWPVMNGDLRLFNWPENDDHRSALTRAWTELVEAEPGAYLHHRSRVFRALLQFGTIYNQQITVPVWHIHESAEQVDLSAEDTAPQRAMQHVLDWIASHTPINRPYIYFVVSLIFLPLARRHRDAMALLLSGILYELTLVPFSPSAEFRYSHWLICSTVVAAALLVHARMHPRLEPVAEA